MLIIPAIDIKNGKCVRLKQGDMNRETIYSEDPLTMAKRWVGEGARRLHIVDLDGASLGEPINADIVHKMTENHPEVPIQIGGGIRSQQTVDAYIQAGVQYVIIGTQAVREPLIVNELCAKYPGQVIVGLDARNGKVAIEGWSELSQHNVVELARKFANAGIDSIVYTDIARDGMLQGVNVKAAATLAKAVNVPVIASGGVSDLCDIHRLAHEAKSGIMGVIAGRALYEGTLDFATSQKVADELAATSNAAR